MLVYENISSEEQHISDCDKFIAHESVYSTVTNHIC